MESCLLVRINRTELSFWYKIKGAQFAPLQSRGESSVPLYFYVSEGDFIMGEIARQKMQDGDSNTFGDYFEIIKDPTKFFNIYNDSKPVKKLIYFGIESYITNFIKTVLYKSESIETYRANFCLRFWFDLDIEEKEQIFVLQLFKEAGYENIESINFSGTLIETVETEYSVSNHSHLISLRSIDNNLFFQYIFPLNRIVKHTSYLRGLGSDPRVNILAELIVKDIEEVNPSVFIDVSKEVLFIRSSVNKLLKKLSPVISGEVSLSSGKNFSYKVRKKELDKQLQFYSGFEKIFLEIEDLIQENSINLTNVSILVLGEEINTDYFLNVLAQKYTSVIGLDEGAINLILSKIFEKIEKNQFKLSQKEQPQKPNLPPVPKGENKPPNVPEIKKPDTPYRGVPDMPKIKMPPKSLPTTTGKSGDYRSAPPAPESKTNKPPLPSEKDKVSTKERLAKASNGEKSSPMKIQKPQIPVIKPKLPSGSKNNSETKAVIKPPPPPPSPPKKK